MKLTWGDSVVVAQSAPPQFRPGSLGSICGMRQIDQGTASLLGVELGTLVYTVEFKDGIAVEIPEAMLRKEQ